MNIIEGNLITLALAGKFDVIIHGCNCYHTMGSGIAKSIKEYFPNAYKEDCRSGLGTYTKLGTYTQSIETSLIYTEFHVINGYTQHKMGSHGPHVNYGAIKTLFESIKKNFNGKRIGYPLIGAGLAGGDWNIISKIINDALIDEDHTLVKFANP